MFYDILDFRLIMAVSSNWFDKNDENKKKESSSFDIQLDSTKNEMKRIEFKFDYLHHELQFYYAVD